MGMGIIFRGDGRLLSCETQGCTFAPACPPAYLGGQAQIFTPNIAAGCQSLHIIRQSLQSNAQPRIVRLGESFGYNGADLWKKLD